ncbi:MAG: winged helix-turn-helix domain-containing protein [Acidobacteria bacterium]|nr:winged helix-turn-helix domain-containing protein [Acidobacteriota bacterium]
MSDFLNRELLNLSIITLIINATYSSFDIDECAEAEKIFVEKSKNSKKMLYNNFRSNIFYIRYKGHGVLSLIKDPEFPFYHPVTCGKATDVLEQVGQLMKPVLKDVDFDPLASDPSNPRWRNAAQWAQNSMVQECLLKSDSPQGVWEISGEGRAQLSQTKR